MRSQKAIWIVLLGLDDVGYKMMSFEKNNKITIHKVNSMLIHSLPIISFVFFLNSVTGSCHHH